MLFTFTVFSSECALLRLFGVSFGISSWGPKSEEILDTVAACFVFCRDGDTLVMPTHPRCRDGDAPGEAFVLELFGLAPVGVGLLGVFPSLKDTLPLGEADVADSPPFESLDMPLVPSLIDFIFMWLDSIDVFIWSRGDASSAAEVSGERLRATADIFLIFTELILNEGLGDLDSSADDSLDMLLVIFLIVLTFL